MTLAELIIDFKNMVGPAGKGSEVSDSGIGVWLQEAQDDIVDEILRVNPLFFTQVATTSTIPNQKEYALPSDFIKLLQLEIDYDGSGGWVKALPIQHLVQLDSYSSNNGYSVGEPRYYILGSFFGLEPAPTASGTNNIKLIYSNLIPEMEDTVESSLPRVFQRKLKYRAYANYLDQNDEHVAAERMRNRFEADIQRLIDNVVVRNEDVPLSVLITEDDDLYTDMI